MKHRAKGNLRRTAIAGIAALAGTVGCGDDETVVQIDTGEEPALLAFRAEGQAAWRALPVEGQTKFEVAVDGPYELIIVCTSGGAHPLISAFRYARTPDDELFIDHGCRNSARPHTVRGQVVQPGGISFAGSGRATTMPNWPFAVTTDPGQFELLLWSGDLNDGFDKLAIRRDIAVNGDLDLGTIDLTREPLQPLVPVSFTASNLLPEETKFANLFLDTGGTRAFFFLPFDAEWNVRLVPESMLLPSDEQSVQLTASTQPQDALQRHSRSRSMPVRVGDASSVTLPPAMGPATFETSTDRVVATWTTLPELDTLRLDVESFSENVSSLCLHTTLLTTSYLQATGAQRAEVDFRDVPGFKPEWKHDPSSSQFHSLTATEALEGDVTLSAGVDEQVEPAAKLRATRESAAARAARLQLESELPLPPLAR